jgi:hypothetical protein
VTQPDVHADGGFRARWLSAVVLAVTVALGLLSRRFPLPGILAEYTGDALYTVAAFLGLALLLPAARTRSLAVLALAFSVARLSMGGPAGLPDRCHACGSARRQPATPACPQGVTFMAG